jgi:hypothetical protein
MDSYTKCDCGSGEKYKFCCQKAEAYILKVDRQIESNLPAAAVATLEEGLKKYPDTPALLLRRALLTRSGTADDQAVRMLEAYLAKHPNHIGVRNMLIMLTLKDEGPEVAALELQRSFARMSDDQKRYMARLAGQIAEAFMEEGKPLAGAAHALLQIMWDGAQSASVRLLLEIQQAPQTSLWLRNNWMPAAPSNAIPDDLRDEFTKAFDKASVGQWLEAAESFGRIAARDTSGLSYRNQGLCMAMLGENFTAVECLRASAAILGETEDAVDIEALCQELDPPGEEDLVDRLQLTWPVRSAQSLEAAMAASDRFVEFELDEDVPETADTKNLKTYAVLDRPKLKPGEAIALDKVPRVVATVTVDNRNASLAALDDGILDATTEIFRETAGSAIVPAHPRTKHLGKVPRQDPMETFRWYLPEETSPEARKDFFDRRFVQDLETVWPVTPQKALGRRTPEKAAADGNARVPLRAALMRLTESPHGSKAEAAIASLRHKLNLPQEPAPSADAIEQVPIPRLPQLDLNGLPVDRLAAAFERATRYFVPSVIRKAGDEWLSRPVGDSADAEARLKVYQELAMEAIAHGDLPRALDLIARGHAEDKSHTAEMREAIWGLAAIRCKAALLDPAEWVPDLAVLLDRKRGDSKTEDEVSQLVVVRLMELGLIRLVPHPDRPEQAMMDTRVLEFLLQKYGPKITTATGELGVSVSKSQIWTPGSAGGGSGQGGKIWTPGQSATPPASSAQEPAPKLFVPGT